MEKTFKYNGVEMIAYWNGKSYRGTKYVSVKCPSVSPYSKGTEMVWNDERGWTKNGGMHYADEVRQLFGWE